MDKNTTNQLVEIAKRYNKELEELYRNYNREVKAIFDAHPSSYSPLRIQYSVDKPSDDCTLDFVADDAGSTFYHKYIDGVEFEEVVRN